MAEVLHMFDLCAVDGAETFTHSLLNRKSVVHEGLQLRHCYAQLLGLEILFRNVSFVHHDLALSNEARQLFSL